VTVAAAGVGVVSVVGTLSDARLGFGYGVYVDY